MPMAQSVFSGALDFDVAGDHDVLDASGLLVHLERLLSSADAVVRGAATALFQLEDCSAARLPSSHSHLTLTLALILADPPPPPPPP